MKMAYSESVLNFRCEGENLLGILSSPVAPKTSSDIGVIIVVGGPQYRVGSHRQFVQLARGLASAGYGVLRFDYRGMGDSGGAQRDFEGIEADIAAAIDCLLAHNGGQYKRVVLWGLCDAASAALLYWQSSRDSRVKGMALANPWVRSEASLARTQIKHYYLQRLLAPDFWRKFLRGRVAKDALSGLLRSALSAIRSSTEKVDTASKPLFQQCMKEALLKFDGRMLFLLCERDMTAQEFLAFGNQDASLRNLLASSKVELHRLPTPDHTFSNADDKCRVETITKQWMTSFCR
jgi:exosortase A-associated hydrolase 1